MRALLHVENLEKNYFSERMKVEVLKGIDLSINKGSFTTILGASGVGKTTLLNCLAGISYVDNGKITMDIENHLVDIAKLNEIETLTFRRKYLGFIFQFYNLISTFNILENVELSARLAEISKPRQKSKEILREVGLEDRYKQYPATLSGGEQQRVAIARALVKEPTLILADEITGNLDSVRSSKIFHLLKNLIETREVAIVVVTHNPKISNFIKGTTYSLYQGKLHETQGEMRF